MNLRRRRGSESVERRGGGRAERKQRRWWWQRERIWMGVREEDNVVSVKGTNGGERGDVKKSTDLYS